MPRREHRYATHVEWTGNTGQGTATYAAYERRHVISAPGFPKPPIPGSSDPSFRGDPARWNPEELLVAALSACHKLWFLHLCSDAGLVVTAYVDEAEGIMREESNGSGRFLRVVLKPRVTFDAASREQAAELANSLHERAHALCFIANSVSFPVEHQAAIVEAPTGITG